MAALAVPFGSRAEAARENWCVFFDDEVAVSAPAEPEEEGDLVKEIPGVRAPFAEEVGPISGRKTNAITPLPGLPLDTSFDSVGWITQGPAPTKNGVTNVPPEMRVSGCVTAAAPHPSDQNILYIGAANGGIWRTQNALADNPRWKALTDDQLSLSIGALAFDPTDANNNTLVAGFARLSSLAQPGGAHKGLLRTTDGGTTWTRLGESALAGRSVVNVAARGATILAAVRQTDNATLVGLYRTTDGGGNFSNMSGLAGSGLPAGGITHLAADPTNTARFYVHVSSVGVYRSDNSGANWVNQILNASG
jgi:hypothetical protein